ncbi:unnamed protein product [Owenia fusiformis]|uniref:Uncharacterized protein n=1 Tax=Owenia fusiformis TaxID=6347 RepID=A0A8S4PX74_OWEFU|nr:unnamed protein product [Owenia fusiformis]
MCILIPCGVFILLLRVVPVITKRADTVEKRSCDEPASGFLCPGQQSKWLQLRCAPEYVMIKTASYGMSPEVLNGRDFQEECPDFDATAVGSSVCWSTEVPSTVLNSCKDKKVCQITPATLGDSPCESDIAFFTVTYACSNTSCGFDNPPGGDGLPIESDDDIGGSMAEENKKYDKNSDADNKNNKKGGASKKDDKKGGSSTNDDKKGGSSKNDDKKDDSSKYDNKKGRFSKNNDKKGGASKSDESKEDSSKEEESKDDPDRDDNKKGGSSGMDTQIDGTDEETGTSTLESTSTSFTTELFQNLTTEEFEVSTIRQEFITSASRNDDVTAVTEADALNATKDEITIGQEITEKQDEDTTMPYVPTTTSVTKRDSVTLNEQLEISTERPEPITFKNDGVNVANKEDLFAITTRQNITQGQADTTTPYLPTKIITQKDQINVTEDEEGKNITATTSNYFTTNPLQNITSEEIEVTTTTIKRPELKGFSSLNDDVIPNDQINVTENEEGKNITSTTSNYFTTKPLQNVVQEEDALTYNGEGYRIDENDMKKLWIQDIVKLLSILTNATGSSELKHLQHESRLEAIDYIRVIDSVLTRMKEPFTFQPIATKSLVWELKIQTIIEHSKVTGAILFPESSNATSHISLPFQVFKGQNVSSVVSILYRNMTEVLGPIEQRNGHNNVIGDDIVSTVILPKPKVPLLEPIQLQFKHLSVRKNSGTNRYLHRKCVFLDTTASSKGLTVWSEEGCNVTYTDDNVTRCSCNHLTNFAVLVRFTDTEISVEHETILGVISLLGVSISLLGELITLFAILTVRTNNNNYGAGFDIEKKTIRVNLLVTMAATHVVFLIGAAVDIISNMILCKVMAIVLHYFLLLSFMWMLAEGYYLYRNIVRAYNEKMDLKILIALFYGFPGLYIAVSASVGYDYYGTLDGCWLSLTTNFRWVLITPLLLIILINTVILGMVIRVIHTLSHVDYEDKITKAKASIKAVVVLFPILGLSWLLAGLTIIQRGYIVYQYLFAICNSFQGLFIFVFHCLLNTEVRTSLISKLSQWRDECSCLSCPSSCISCPDLVCFTHKSRLKKVTVSIKRKRHGSLSSEMYVIRKVPVDKTLAEPEDEQLPNSISNSSENLTTRASSPSINSKDTSIWNTTKRWMLPKADIYKKPDSATSQRSQSSNNGYQSNTTNTSLH